MESIFIFIINEKRVCSIHFSTLQVFLRLHAHLLTQLPWRGHKIIQMPGGASKLFRSRALENASPKIAFWIRHWSEECQTNFLRGRERKKSKFFQLLVKQGEKFISSLVKLITWGSTIFQLRTIPNVQKRGSLLSVPPRLGYLNVRHNIEYLKRYALFPLPLSLPHLFFPSRFLHILL